EPSTEPQSLNRERPSYQNFSPNRRPRRGALPAERGRDQSGQRVLVGVSRDDVAEATVVVRRGRDARTGIEVDLAAVHHAPLARFDRLIARIEDQERDAVAVGDGEEQ